MKNIDYFSSSKWQNKSEKEYSSYGGFGEPYWGSDTPPSLRKLGEYKWEIEVSYYKKQEQKNTGTSLWVNTSTYKEPTEPPLFKLKKVFYMKRKNNRKIDKLLSEINCPFKHEVTNVRVPTDGGAIGMAIECINPIVYIDVHEAKRWLREQKLKRILKNE